MFTRQIMRPKEVSPLVLESACQGMGEEKWEVLLVKQDGYLWISIMQPWTWRCSHAQRKHVYLQLLSGCFLSVSAIHTKWGPRGAMTGLSS